MKNALFSYTDTCGGNLTIYVVSRFFFSLLFSLLTLTMSGLKTTNSIKSWKTKISAFCLAFVTVSLLNGLRTCVSDFSICLHYYLIAVINSSY